MSERIKKIYSCLYEFFGPQHWWPGDSMLEIMVGAVLTQNTNWRNVEKAIANMKAAGIMEVKLLNRISEGELASYIRPAGYFNVKARRLKNLIAFVCQKYNGNLKLMCNQRVESLREELLSIKGLGPETVDSILLYAANKAIFVVDAYTKRIFSRCGLCFEDISYQELQDLISRNIDKDVKIYNEFHALLVRLGKQYCKKQNPMCKGCPIKEYCDYEDSNDR